MTKILKKWISFKNGYFFGQTAVWGSNRGFGFGLNVCQMDVFNGFWVIIEYLKACVKFVVTPSILRWLWRN